MKREYTPIPEPEYDPVEVNQLMRINIDILKKEITEHIDNELRRFYTAIEEKGD